MDKSKKVELLDTKISFIEELAGEYNPNNLRQWREETLMILDNLITVESKYYTNFEDIRYVSGVITPMDSVGNSERNKKSYFAGLERAKSSLKAIVFGIQNDLI
ncbi:MAG: hypothetical protein WC851_00280 [Candidatus Shapirobacteria bacterium]|jgi:hypothetical protein